MKTDCSKSAGFTLVEVIAVLVLVAILTAVALPKFIAVQIEAQKKELFAGIAEFNTREKLLWEREMMAQDASVLVSDATLNEKIYGEMDGYLDPDKVGGDSSGSSQSGENWTYTHGKPWPVKDQTVYSTLEFKDVVADVVRSSATLTQPAIWKVSSISKKTD